MVRKIFIFLFIGAVLAAAFVYFRYLGPATGFAEKEKFLLVYSNNKTKSAVLATLEKDSIIKDTRAFEQVAGYLKYWNSIKPGRYKIEKGMSTLAIVRLLRNGIQTPNKLVINKLRLTTDLAKAISRSIETDSATVAGFLENKDSLATLGLSPENWSAHIIPNTYEVFWTNSLSKTINKLKQEREKWWAKNERIAKASAKNLTPEQVHILASIVEEESNNKADRPIIASVYLNRIKKGMPLQADPTVRFALKDFISNRVLYSHLRVPSPYNTYLNMGLPPGPICTPMATTLENVLDAPETDYIFFVADADLNGGSTFTTNLADHNRAAKLYQDSLTAWLKRKAAKEKAGKASATPPK
jgi:UPF0755 protein